MEVGILGVVHDDALRFQYDLTLEVIKELILDFDPDVICGEVLPTSFEKYKEDSDNRGYWGEPPSEYYELIFPICNQQKIKFVPIDWVELDIWNDFDPLRDYSGLEKEHLEKELEIWWEKQKEAAIKGDIPFNTASFDTVTKQKYQWLKKLDQNSHFIRWECRHLIMLQRIRNAIKDNPNGKILCIVGADHNHILKEELNNLKDVQIIYPLR
ncbi:hypothetical protein [Paenibacillus shenyangensis]|uniref:hypothetical protein n=1 Tax=Paenibacillus sp. A9 TaxID=1284352 RepID=UPI00037AAAFA|nr:hypothetical protein [Paenibacillus sp. A9]